MDVRITNTDGHQAVTIEADGVTYVITEIKHATGNGLLINMQEMRRILTVVPVSASSIRINGTPTFTAPVASEKRGGIDASVNHKSRTGNRA